MARSAQNLEKPRIEVYWAPGFHAPRGVAAADVGRSLQGTDKSPETLLELSKDKNHPLHEAVWGEGDQVWANRGRMELCRKVISAIRVDEITSKKTITYRMYEYIKQTKSWHDLPEIVVDPTLDAEYQRQIMASIDELQSKLRRYFDLKNRSE
jgi:hypothetical protein